MEADFAGAGAGVSGLGAGASSFGAGASSLGAGASSFAAGASSLAGLTGSGAGAVSVRMGTRMTAPEASVVTEYLPALTASTSSASAGRSCIWPVL